MLDWVAHLKYLQSILLKYDLIRAPTELMMLRYFRKSLKPSILAELEHKDLEQENFDQMVKKAVNVKAKLAFQSCFNTGKIDQNYPYGNQLANSTIIKSQGSTMKDSWVEEPKTQGPKSLSGPQLSMSSFQYSNKPFEKAQKEKKKK